MSYERKFQSMIDSYQFTVNVAHYSRLMKIIKHVSALYPYAGTRADGFETHHIIPRSWGGSNDYCNLVHIPYRLHFLIHRLMAKVFFFDKSMVTAFYFMSNVDKNKISSKEYSDLRSRYIEHLKAAHISGSIVSMFQGHVPVRYADGLFGLVQKEDYTITSLEYKHVATGRLRPQYEIDAAKEAFSSGKRVSGRKGKVMAKHNETETHHLVAQSEFATSNVLVGISKGNIISEKHREAISKFMAAIPRTKAQKDSARRLMVIQCNTRISCDCCGKSFNSGNYKKHTDNITVKGRKLTEEQKNNQRLTIKQKNIKLGTVKSIYTVEIDSKFYAIYDILEAARKFGTSLPTFRKKTRPTEVGSHRNRTVLRLYTEVNLKDLEIFED